MSRVLYCVLRSNLVFPNVSPESETAVVRGALMKGLSDIRGVSPKLPRIRTRKARKHYGTQCVTPYKARRHSGDEGHSPERK